MGILRPFSLSILFAIAGTVTRACDLCGCYTPQLEAMTEMASAPLLYWATGSYAAVGEQFTRFATVQVNGNEIANRTGQIRLHSFDQ
jgi:hypothetical protein